MPSSDGNIREAINTLRDSISTDVETVNDATHSLPAAGTTGQVLDKVDGTDYNVQWVDPSVTAAQISDATTAGRSMLTAANAAAQLALLPVPVPTITDFSSSGTYTIPSWAKTLKVLSWGSHGGAQSGGRGAAGTARYGGGGGSSGAYMEREVTIAELAALPGYAGSLIITIGAKGVGGAAQTADNTAGNPGTNGGPTTVQVSATVNLYLVYAVAGRGGNNGLGGIAVGGFAPGIAGAPSTVAGTPAAAAAGSITGGGGGAGGSITSADVALAGGNGGLGAQACGDPAATQNAGGTGGTAGGNGGSPAAATFAEIPRGGGGGGAASITGAAGAGADGGAGGGGGASLNGYNSGKGGDGQAGYVRVLAFG